MAERLGRVELLSAAQFEWEMSSLGPGFEHLILFGEFGWVTLLEEVGH